MLDVLRKDFLVVMPCEIHDDVNVAVADVFRRFRASDAQLPVDHVVQRANGHAGGLCQAAFPDFEES